MKHRTYTLTEHDVETITEALTVLPHIDLDDSVSDIDYLCVSTGSKLVTHQPLDSQDFSVIYTALTSVREICQGEFPYVDAEVKAQCKEIFFDAGRLLAALSSPR